MTPLTVNTQTCRVLVGAPGCGKTARMLAEMAEQRGCYVLAAPRQDLLEEHVARLQGFAAQAATTPTLQTIHSRQGARERVGRRVTEALAASHADAHVVLAITHEALLSLDGALLTNWHVRIDEIPDAVVRSGQVRIGATWPALSAYYALALPGHFEGS
jgi:predicted ATPase